MTHSLAKNNCKKNQYLQDLSAEPLLLDNNKQRFHLSDHLLKQNKFLNNEKYPQTPHKTYQDIIQIEQLVLKVCIKVKIKFPLSLSLILPTHSFNVSHFIDLLTSKQFTDSVYAQYFKQASECHPALKQI